jgi:hypothetical protein
MFVTCDMTCACCFVWHHYPRSLRPLWIGRMRVSEKSQLCVRKPSPKLALGSTKTHDMHVWLGLAFDAHHFRSTPIAPQQHVDNDGLSMDSNGQSTHHLMLLQQQQLPVAPSRPALVTQARSQRILSRPHASRLIRKRLPQLILESTDCNINMNVAIVVPDITLDAVSPWLANAGEPFKKSELASHHELQAPNLHRNVMCSYPLRHLRGSQRHY